MTFINIFWEDGLESLTSYSDLPRMCFGLLTYIPLLVTEKPTVYAAYKDSSNSACPIEQVGFTSLLR